MSCGYGKEKKNYVLRRSQRPPRSSGQGKCLENAGAMLGVILEDEKEA